MAENSKIEWTDHTFNPWVGCTKVSPACDHCYAEGWAKRAGKAAGVVWGGERRRTSESTWRQPLKWERAAALAEAGWRSGLELANGDEAQLLRSGFVKPRRPRVFCASLADVFDNQVPAQWRISLMRLIVDTPHLDWLLLTKRIGNASGMLETAFRAVHHGREGWADNVPPNVWIGATVCDQAEADRDVPKLLEVPAAVRFLSVEPMLGPISFEGMFANPGRPEDGTNALEALDWVICGGESGPQARPMHPDWARSLRDQCAAAGVKFLFKQHGEWAPGSGDFGRGGFITAAIDRSGRVAPGGISVGDYPAGATSADGWAMVHKAGKKAAGRLLDGRTHDEFPGA